MTDMLSISELLRLRMSAQQLGTQQVGTQQPPEPQPAQSPSAQASDETGAARIAATARHMLAVQGQGWRSARWALGVRTPGTTVDDVHEACNQGLIVRSWPMRGTIHLLPAADIAWMQAVTNPRVLAGAPKRREFLGITDAVLDRLVETSLSALHAHTSLDRDELAALWSDAGIEWQSNWRYHLIWWLCQNGLAVFGPVSADGEPRLVLASRWLTRSRTLSGDEALAEFASRYAAARGAVTAKDLAWWAGITATTAKRALMLASESGALVTVEVQASEDQATTRPAPHWASPTALNALQGTEIEGGEIEGDWLLLPAFDEHLLGYQDRAAQLDPAHFERIVPGRNGMFLATVVHAGRVVATWKKSPRKADGLAATALPGYDLGSGLPALQQRAAEWSAFQGVARLPFTLAS
ncbi:MAG: winged helix DNA-binding domain-containing protein [Leucobacter sp.]|nr:winged helix DNA-binding domain-containing protein [Leucobacter sp.]